MTDSAETVVVPSIDSLPDYPALSQLMAALWGHAESRGAAVMVGAGFSRFAHRDSPATPWPPLWSDLAREMRHRLGDHAAQDPLKLAEEFQAAFDRPTLDGFLRSAVADTRWRPGELHGRLLGLPWADVLSTNWDTLLERTAPSDPDRNYEVVLHPEDIARTRAPRIVKLHGDLSGSPSMVFTAEDFRRFPRKLAPFVNLAQQVLLENELCLIGFSGDDPNFLAWSGWVRDELGASARRIRLVGVLNLSPARRKVLQAQGVTPIDLHPLVRHLDCDPDEQHRTAVQLFIEALWAAKPTPRHAWAPQAEWPHDAKASAEGLDDLTARWRAERAAYPHWLVAPPDVQDALLHRTFASDYRQRESFALASSEGRAAYLVERIWRLRTGLHSVDGWVAEALTDLLEGPGLTLSRADRGALRLALAAQARYDHDWPRFDALIAAARSDLGPGPDVAYELALRARDRQDYADLEARLPEVGGEDPIWRMRRGALRAELEDVEGAAADYQAALGEIRRRRASDRDDLALLSREAWAQFMLRAARNGSWKLGLEVEERSVLPAQVARCDPQRHYEALDRQLEEFRKRRLEDENPITTSFDAGAYRDGRHGSRIVTSNPDSELARLRRWADTIGLPSRIGNADVLGHLATRLLSEIERPGEDHLRVAARLVQFPEKGPLDVAFSRVEIARAPAALVEALAEDAWRTAQFALERGDAQERRWIALAAAQIELLSRLLFRMSPDVCQARLRWGLELLNDTQFGTDELHKAIGNLVRRAVDGVPPAAREPLFLEALQAPLAEERKLRSHWRDWPDLAGVFGGLKIGRPNEDQAWTRRIAELIGHAGRNTGSRPSALHWLIWLDEAGALRTEERRALGDAIWRFARPNGLPDNTSLRADCFLALPDTPPGRGRAGFEHEILAPLLDGQLSVSNLGALQAAVRRGRFALRAGDATRLLDHLLAWRPKAPKSHDLFGEVPRTNEGVARMRALVLADAILPALSTDDLAAEEREAKLLESVLDVAQPTLVIATAQLLRLLPDARSALVANLRRSLALPPLEFGAATAAIWRFDQSPNLGIPSEVVRDLVACCAFRQDAGAYQALAAAERLLVLGVVDAADCRRLADVVAETVRATDYATWETRDPRTRVVTLIRAVSVRLAAALQAGGAAHPALEAWLNAHLQDPAPEVRFALQGEPERDQ